MGKLWKGQFEGNPFIGMFARASDDAVLIPRASHEKFENAARATLGTEKIVRISVDGAPYLGLFCAMNSNGVVVPRYLSDEEAGELKAAGLNVHRLTNSGYSAIGNNVACNDSGALINPDMPRADAKKIADCLGVEFEMSPIAGYRTPGMACAATNKGFAAHNRISEAELSMLESLFKCKGMNVTVNSGTALAGLGVCANSHGAMIGETSSGFELARISQALDIV